MNELIPKQKVDVLKDMMVRKGETLAIAESVTAGVLQAVISAATDASKFYQGGITAYNIGQKVLHLGVEPIKAEQCNCVSPQTASEMALGVAELFRSDWGIGITGYASPVPESDNELFAFYAVSYKGAIVMEEKIVPASSVFFKVQLEYAIKVVERLQQQIKE